MAILTQVVHHSDRGSQHVAEDYTRELVQLGVWLSVGSTGNSYDNVLAESVNGAYKTELVRGRFFESVAQLGGLPRRVGCVGGIGSGCIRLLVIGLLRRWWMML